MALLLQVMAGFDAHVVGGGYAQYLFLPSQFTPLLVIVQLVVPEQLTATPL